MSLSAFKTIIVFSSEVTIVPSPRLILMDESSSVNSTPISGIVPDTEGI